MAEYGVNIAVAVKNSQAVTQLSSKLKDTASKIEQINTNFTTFAGLTGKVLPGSIANFNKALSDAKKNLNDVALNTGEAATAAREFFEAQNQANAAIKEQGRLLKEIRREGATVPQRQGMLGPASSLGPDPRKGFSSAVGRQRALAQMVARETAAEVKIADAKRKYALEIGQIKLDLDRKVRNAEIDNIIEEFRIENELQDNLFKKAIENDKKDAARFMESLGLRKNAELTAIAEIDQARKKAAGEAVRLTGQTSPVDGAVGIPGSPAALRAAERSAERSQKFRSAASSALIGGAFPLLFGQGAGAAFGGAAGGFGGGMLGGEFGFGLSLIGTQLGATVDQLVSKAGDLGAALNPLTADLDAIAVAAGEGSSEFSAMLGAIEEQLGAQRALEEATNRLALVIGIEAVNDLKVFSEDMNEIGDEFNKLTSLMLGGIAALINQAGILKKVSAAVERKRLLEKGKTSTDPETVRLEKLRQESINKGDVKRTGELIDQIVARQRDIELREIGNQNAAIADDLANKQLATLRKTTTELKAERTILEGNRDLLNEQVFAAERQLLVSELTTKTKKIEQRFDEAKKAGKPVSDIVRRGELDVAATEFENQMIELTSKRTKAQEAVDKATDRASQKAARGVDMANKKAKREDERKQRAIDRRVETANTEIERATKAFDRVDSQLDSIISKNKDKVAFEREYAELIRNGSTPAAAKQAVELKKQQLELDRNFEKLKEQLDLSVDVAKAAILEAKARGASGKELDDLNQGLADLLDKIGKLPGKKEDAEGAILEALAPKSDRERLQEYLDNLQGQLNDLNDPVKQIIGLAETLGGAFSESFKGIVSGSMTAREALANLFQRTADHFLDMAAQMIAAQIKMKILGIAVNFFGGGGFNSPAASPGGSAGVAGIGGGMTNPFGNSSLFGAPFSLTGKALGGPVSSGQPYLVGERGPEMFVPGAQGNIVPNNAMGGGANVTVNVDASGSSVQGDGPNASQLGKAIGAAVQAELIKQKRPGGLLTR